MSDGALAQRIQDAFVLLCITDPTFLGLCEQSVPAKYFSSQVTEDIIKICYAYYRQFKTAPDGHFNDELIRFLEHKDDDDVDLYLEYLEGIQDMDIPNREYIVSRMNEFIKASELKVAAIKFAKKVQAGDFAEAEVLMQKALKAGIRQEEQGIDFFSPDEPSFLNEDSTESERLMGTPWSVINERLTRGICRTDMVLIMGSSKGKKTWSMTDFGAIGLVNGRKVLHISHEMSASDTQKRYYRVLGCLGRNRETEGVVIPKVDFEGNLIMSKEYQVKSVYDPDVLKETQRAARRFGGGLIIKKYPTASCTVAEMERYLDWLEHTEGFIPDIIINDYVEKMKIQFGDNRRHHIHEVYLESKRIADERHIAMFTVSQVNRGAIEKAYMAKADAAEDIRKIDTVDLCIGIGQNKKLARDDRMMATVMANRHGPDHFGCLYTTALDAGMFVSNCWVEPNKDDDDDDE